MKKLPTITPLAPTRRREPFNHPDWVFELKQDGFRGVAYISSGECRLVSRNGNVFRRFLLLCKMLSKLPARNAILDGEIICVNGDGVSQFNQLMFRRGVPYFYAFDLLWLDGIDLRRRSLLERKEQLKRLILGSHNPTLLCAAHIDRYGIDFFRMICEKDLEGIVAKHKDGRFDTSTRWIKIKNPAYSQIQQRHELFEKSAGPPP